MAEAEAFRSIALPFALFALLGCAADADVISDAPPPRQEFWDGSVSSPPWIDGGRYDAGPGPELDATLDAAMSVDAAPDAPWLEVMDAGPPQWSACDPALDLGHTGDSCSFVGGCARSVPQCSRHTALCTDLTLYLGEISKSECVPDDPGNMRRCATPLPGSCCIKMWQCNEGTAEHQEGQAFATVCAVGCETSSFPRGDTPVTGCPDDPATPLWPRWPPDRDTPCKGSFVCDSLGQSAGPDTEVFQFDAYGRVYWCQNGMVRQVATGPSLPWNP